MDLIDRKAAIDLLDVGAELLRLVLDNMDVVGADREKYSWGLALIEAYISDMKELPSAQPEILACGEGELIAQPELRSFSCGQENDLISRQAAIDALHMHLMYRMGTDSNKKRLDEWINNLPSAQPEQRWIPCGKCIHADGKHRWCKVLDRTINEDYFCYWAEPFREEGETDG